ncbi:MAG: hypothetical protein ACK58L_04455 [Planctomycetota bacterium]
MVPLSVLLLVICGYLLTVFIEIPVLLLGMARQHGIRDTMVNGLLLTAFTYPIVVMVLPAAFAAMKVDNRMMYLAVAEFFAPAAEVMFFRFLTNKPVAVALDRDVLVIVVANLASFLLGEAGLSQWLTEIAGKLATP